MRELARDPAFAGALLFPGAVARKWLPGYQKARSAPRRVSVLMEAAVEYVISPFSVYKELEKLAQAEGLPFEPLSSSFLHAEIAGLNKQLATISEQMFDGTKPSADRYMRLADERFDTPFFKALGEHVKKTEVGESVISRMLDIPLVDAREIRAALA